MDISSGSDYPSSALSNFAPHPFVFRGVECCSMEGLLQSFKFKNPEMQKEICKLVGIAAKRRGYHKNWQATQILYWQGTPIMRNSDEYQRLLDDAFYTLYSTNGKAKSALLATHSATLTHSIGRANINETVLTKQEFCSRLMKIRKKIQVAQALDGFFSG